MKQILLYTLYVFRISCATFWKVILRLHLHDIDNDMVDRLHSLTNRGLGLGLNNPVLDNNTISK